MKIQNAYVHICSPGRNFVTLKIETDEGIYGLGDATLNGRELADRICAISPGVRVLYMSGYADDAAYKRAKVAEVAIRFPRALDELRSGALHLTALLLLSSHLTDDNAGALFSEARGKSRREDRRN